MASNRKLPDICCLVCGTLFRPRRSFTRFCSIVCSRVEAAKSHAQEMLRQLPHAQTRECIDWPFSRGSNGYGQVRVDGRLRNVSYLMCRERHGPPPTAKHQAAHSCGRGRYGCVNLYHLDWKTPAANQADRLEHGTHNRGERQGSSKLSREQVIQIRELAAAAVMQKEIAAQFGVTPSCVQSIVSRENWRWL